MVNGNFLEFDVFSFAYDLCLLSFAVWAASTATIGREQHSADLIFLNRFHKIAVPQRACRRCRVRAIK